MTEEPWKGPFVTIAVLCDGTRPGNDASSVDLTNVRELLELPASGALKLPGRLFMRFTRGTGPETFAMRARLIGPAGMVVGDPIKHNVTTDELGLSTVQVRLHALTVSESGAYVFEIRSGERVLTLVPFYVYAHGKLSSSAVMH